MQSLNLNQSSPNKDQKYIYPKRTSAKRVAAEQDTHSQVSSANNRRINSKFLNQSQRESNTSRYGGLGLSVNRLRDDLASVNEEAHSQEGSIDVDMSEITRNRHDYTRVALHPFSSSYFKFKQTALAETDPAQSLQVESLDQTEINKEPQNLQPPQQKELGPTQKFNLSDNILDDLDAFEKQCEVRRDIMGTEFVEVVRNPVIEGELILVEKLNQGAQQLDSHEDLVKMKEELKMPVESGIIPYTVNYAEIHVKEEKEGEPEQAADKGNDKEKQQEGSNISDFKDVKYDTVQPPEKAQRYFKQKADGALVGYNKNANALMMPKPTEFCKPDFEDSLLLPNVSQDTTIQGSKLTVMPLIPEVHIISFWRQDADLGDHHCYRYFYIEGLKKVDNSFSKHRFKGEISRSKCLFKGEGKEIFLIFKQEHCWMLGLLKLDWKDGESGSKEPFACHDVETMRAFSETFPLVGPNKSLYKTKDQSNVFTAIYENLIDNLDDIYSDLRLFRRKEFQEVTDKEHTFLLFPKAKRRPEVCIVSMKKEESKVFHEFRSTPESHFREKMAFVGYDSETDEIQFLKYQLMGWTNTSAYLVSPSAKSQY